MFMFRSRALQTLTAAAAVTAGLVLSAPAALAHDLVIGGDPADKEILQEFPDRIELEFSGYVMEDFNTFAVSDAASEEVLFSGELSSTAAWSAWTSRWTWIRGPATTASASRSRRRTDTPPAA